MARIVVNAERKLGEIHPHVYGQFIEHLDGCIYGGIFEPGSPLSDERGFRKDVLKAIRDLKPAIIRWPGGNFSSGYHWEDGIGDQRRARPELAWRTVEPNTFGTDEFIEYCRAAECDPYICLNMGNGTMDEAIAWIEYCNHDSGTHYSDLRRQHGHGKPHDVTYWGLGNEIWGDFQIGHKSPQDYAWQARDWAKVLKRLAPDIKLIACGGTGNAPMTRWDLEVLERTADLIDYTALHYYWGPREEDPYYTTLAGAYDFERYLRYVEGLIEAVRRDKRIQHPIYISIDEWNVNYHWGDHRMRYTLRDALADAIFIHTMQRHCNAVKMGNLAQTVNVIPCIEAGPEGIFLQSIYWPLWLGANLAGPTLVDCWVECETYEVDFLPGRSLPYLDAVATLDEAGKRVIVSVVNAHASADIGAGVGIVGAEIAEGVTTHTLSADSPDAHNDFDQPDNVKVLSGQLEGGNPLMCSFPPHSLSVLEFQMA